MSKQEEPEEAKRVAKVSEVLDNATKYHKDECYDSILLIMANEKNTVFVSAGSLIDIGVSLTMGLSGHPELIQVFHTSVSAAIDLLQDLANTKEEK